MSDYFKQYIRSVRDFPKPGINFLDISPLIGSAEGFGDAINSMVDPWRSSKGSSWVPEHERRVDAIAALDARGFVFGGALARQMILPLVMIRKKGKLPGETVSVPYSLEYGENEFEIQADVLPKGSRVLIVDDVLATGGSAKAAAELIEKVGSTIAGYSFVMELTFLDGRKNLPEVPIFSLITY